MTEVENEEYEENEEIVEEYEDKSDENKEKSEGKKSKRKSEEKSKGKSSGKSEEKTKGKSSGKSEEKSKSVKKSKETEDDEEEENEESEEKSEEKSEENSEEEKNEEKSEEKSKGKKSKSSNKISNNKESKKSLGKSSSNKKSETSKNTPTDTKSQKKQNIKKDYTDNEIIEMAGFKIEKSSKDKNAEESDEENNKEDPLQKKLEPDSPEIRKIRIQAAKIKNEFPDWKKISETKGGEFAVKCWNCGNINICNSNFSVIQCPVCNEMNKVPKPLDRIDQLLQLAKANTCVTYADINHTVPLVNYIVVCPYCKCDNKVRETACFCVCYMCKNKWTIKKPDNDNVKEIKNQKPPKQKRFEGNYYKYDSKTGTLIPPDKPLRFSDLFYPDPMFYPGYYPINSLSPLYPEYFTPYDDYRYIDRQEKTMKYFDRINQQKKMMEQFGDILDNNNKKEIKNDNNIYNKEKRIETPLDKKIEKPYYHLNYDEDMNKRDILRQLEALDKKSENLMNNRIFPKALTDVSSQHSNKAIKSRYNGVEESHYDNKSRASMNISSMKSDLRAAEMNRSNNNINNNMSKSNSQFSNNKNFRESGNSYTNSNNRSSQNDVSSKYKSIENTYFMNK